jgi:hypothetical protein
MPTPPTEAAHLRAEAEAFLARAARVEGSSLILPRAALAEAPVAVARAAVRQALARTGGLAQVGAGHVDRILGLAQAKTTPGRRVPLPGGREARLTREGIRLGTRAALPRKVV